MNRSRWNWCKENVSKGREEEKDGTKKGRRRKEQEKDKEGRRGKG